MKLNNRHIKIFVTTIAVVAGILCVYSLNANAAFNRQINYQGKLTNASNVAVADGGYNMRFKLYTSTSGGSPIWTETWCYSPDSGGTCDGTGTNNRVTITNGLFSVMLGSTTPLTGVDFNQTLYLGIEIGGTGSSFSGDGEMVPRKRFGAVPAAFVADTLQGLSSSQFFRTDAQNSTSTSSTFLNVLQSGAGKIAEFFGANSASVFSILSNGNVGVGTSTPYATFSVNGQIVAGYLTATTTTASNLPYASTTALTVSKLYDSTGSAGTSGYILQTSGTAANWVSTSSLNIQSNLANVTGTLGVANGGTGATSFGQGWLGINNSGAFISSTSPTVAYVTATSTTATSTFAGGLVAGPSNLFVVDYSSGKIGIGQTPSGANYKLQITGAILATGQSVFSDFTSVKSLGLGYGTGSGDITTDSGSKNISIYTGTGGARLDLVHSTGNIGIGTTSPFAKLSIGGGDIHVGGIITSTSTTATSTLPNLSTTNLAVTSIASSLLKTNSAGYLTAAVAGTDYLTSANVSAYPFGLTGNATSSLTQFNGGLTSYASTTIGGGTQTTGLTVNGGATTTGNAYFAGNVGVGTTSPSASFSVKGSGTGTGRLFVLSDSSNVEKLRILDNGGVTFPTAVTIANGSYSWTGLTVNAGVFGTPAISSAYRSNTGYSNEITIANNGITINPTNDPYSASATYQRANSTIILGGTSASSTYPNAGNVYISGGYALAGGTAGNVILAATSSAGNSGGNVGVGTTSPYSKLTVWGNSSLFAAVNTSSTTIFSIGQSGATTTQFAISGITSALLKTNSIGSIIPAVAGTDYATPDQIGGAYPFPLTGNATSSLTQFNGGLTSYASTTIGGGTQTTGLTVNGGATTTGNAYFAGNVGVGTAVPATKLTVNYSGYGIEHTDGTVRLASYVSSGSSYFGSLTNHPFGILTNNLERITVLSGGNVGIGTTTPFYKLSVEGDASFANNVRANYFSATSTTATSTFAGGFIVGTSSPYSLSVDRYTGRVGVGTLSPVARFDVAGTFSSGGTGIGGINLVTGLDAGTVGTGNQATGDYSFVSGETSGASGYSAVAFGTDNASSGNFSGTLGIANTASGIASFAVGESSIAGPGSRSVAMGYVAVASGDSSMALGDNVVASDYNSIAIGKGFTNSRASSFEVGFGSVMLHVGSTTVGIGTTSPYAKLSVVGQTVAEYFTATSTTAINTFPLLTATTATTTNLAVTSITSSLLKTNSIGQLTAAVAGTDYLTSANVSAYPFGLTGNATSSLTQFNGGLTSYASTTIGGGTQTTGLTVNGGATTTGNSHIAGSLGVGGATAGSYALNVRGSALVGDTFNGSFGINRGAGAGSSILTFLDQGDDAWYFGMPGGSTNFAISEVYPSQNRVYIEDDPGVGSSNQLYLKSGGNIGIGTSSPWRTLSVNGSSDLGTDASAGSFTATSSLATSTFAGGFSAAGSNGLSVFQSGRVGIGSITYIGDSSARIEVEGSASAGAVLRLGTPSSAETYMKFGAFNGTNNIDTKTRNFRIYSTSDTTGFNYNATSGNVGIGTSTMYSKLTTWGTGSLFEAVNNSSTTVFRIGQSGATTTALAITGVTSSLLKTNANGSIIPAIAGTDYATVSQVGSAFPFTPTTFGATNANSTSTLIGFTQGIYSLASSTIGSGSQTGGLTISGGATTTGNAYFAGNVGIGTTTSFVNAKLSLTGGGIRVGSVSGNDFGYIMVRDSGNIYAPGLNGDLVFKGDQLNGSGYAFLNAAGTILSRLTNGGNLGLGTTSPFAKLSIGGGDIHVGGIITSTSTTATSTLPNLSTTNLAITGKLFDSVGSAGSYGSILQSSGSATTWVSTSSLNITSNLANVTGTLGVANGGTGAATFGQGWIYSNGGTGALAASTSPTVNYIVATSTTASNTFAGNVNILSNKALYFGASENGASIYNTTGISNLTIQGGTGGEIVLTGDAIQVIGLLDLGLSTVGSDILPANSNLYNIGSSANKFKNLFLSGTATTTNLAVTSITSSLLKTNSIGQLTAAVAGTDYLTSANVSAYPFGLTGNATSSLTQFNGGLTSYASTTIGGGTQTTGLTVNGGATTTGNAYFAGNVGVGTVSPWTKGVVIGSSAAPSLVAHGTNAIFEVGSTNGTNIAFGNSNSSPYAGWIQARGDVGGVSYPLVFNPSGGNVGIGTTSPYAKLSVVGPVVAEYFHATSTTATSTIAGNLAVGRNITSLESVGGANNPGFIFNTNGALWGNSETVFGVYENGTEYLQIDGLGNIRAKSANGGFIAAATTPESTNPGYIGHGMRRNSTSAGFNFACGESITSLSEPCFDIFPISSNLPDGGIALRVSTSSNRLGVFQVMSTGQVLVGSNATTSGNTLNIIGSADFSGNVGIGTTSPWRALSVNGSSDLGINALAGYFTATSSSATSTFAGGITGPNNFIVQSTSGRVGIGTASPSAALHIVQGALINQPIIRIERSGYTTGYDQYIDHSTGRLTFSNSVSGQSMYLNINGYGNSETGFAFTGSGNRGYYKALGDYNHYIQPNDQYGQGHLIIQSDPNGTGNVGIGTTSPYAKLSVVGQVVGTYFTATTSRASTFPYASTTALSASAICISTDCRTSWPSASGGGVGWASTTGDTNSIFMYGSGKVGIGSSTPFYKLSVEGSSSLGNQAIAGYFTATSTTATSTFAGPALMATAKRLYFGDDEGASIYSSGGASLSLDVPSGLINFNTDSVNFNGGTLQHVGMINDSSEQTVIQLDSAQMLVTATKSVFSGGNVAIGTTTPYSKLTTWGTGSLFEAVNTSSTTIFAIGQNGATTTALAITGVTSSLLKTNANGSIIPAIAGTDYATVSQVGSAFPFTPTTFGATNANSTSTLIGFTQGIYSLASSTIGAGTQTTGLTIYGGATTTGNAYFAGNVGIGTTSPNGRLSIQDSATSYTALTIGNAAYQGSIAFNQNLFGTNSRGLEFTGLTGLRFNQSANGYVDVKNGTLLINWDGPNAQTPFNITRNGSARLAIYDNVNLSNSMEFQGNGTANYSFTSLNNFGIGSSSPLARLDVYGANNGTADLLKVSSVSSFATTTRFVINSSGNVGIGTSTPGTPLTVQSTLSTASTSILTLASTPGNHRPSILFDSFSGAQWRIGFAGTGGFDTNGFSLIDNDLNRTIINVENGARANAINIRTTNALGTVGISTTSPFGNLSVTGLGTGTGKTFVAADSNNRATFVVQDNGNIGMGTTSPHGNLQVVGTTPRITLSDMSAVHKHWYMQSNGGYLYISSTTDSLSDATIPPFIITANGNVGIKTPLLASLATALEVGGDIAFSQTTGTRTLKVDAPSFGGDGGSLLVSAASGASSFGSDAVGGSVSLTAGNGASGTTAGVGGNINITAGDSAKTGSNNAIGGSVNLTAGAGVGTSATLGKGGDIVLNGGTGTGSGNVILASLRGNVGIGTSSPFAKLSVGGGNIHVGGIITSTSTTAASTFPFASTTALSASAICISTDCRTSWPSSSGGGGVGWASTTGDTNSIFMYGSGKVGIGSSTPFYKLSVEGSSSLGNQAIAGYFTATSTTATSVFGGSVNVGSELSLNGPNYKGRLYQDGSETFFMSANFNPATDQGDYGSYSGWRIDMNAPGDELTIRRAGAGYADSSEFVDLVDLTGAGDFGIGTVPSARLHAISTTEQCRFGYDSSNYWNCTTDSNGKTTFDSVGTTPKFAFSDKLTISDGTAANPSIGFTSDDDGSGTGFYRSAANRIGASVNGTFIGQFLSTGFEADSAKSFTFNNRGGFSAPADGQIRIAANGGANLSRFILGSNTSTGYGLCFGSNSTMALCDGTGNATSTRFGVGSTTPWGQISASSTSAYPTLAIEQKSTGPAAVILGGNVGIGTITPQQTLDIKAGGAYGYNGTAVIIASTTQGNYFFGNAGNLTASVSNQNGQNIGLGSYALGALTSGQWNTAIGTNALYSNQGGSSNMALGYGAMQNNVSGIYGTAVGVQALYNSTGHYNTALGKSAGFTLKGGTYNTFIGYQADVASAASTTITNSTAIGNGAIVTADNQVVLGSTSVTQTLLNGNVGVASTSPFARLAITGAGTGTGKTVIIEDSNGRDLFQINDNGNIKIGSSTPTTSLLDVDGVISSGADGNIGGGEIRSYQTPGFYIGMKTDTSVNKSGLYRSNGGGDKYFSWYNTGTGDTGMANIGGAGTNMMFFDNTREAMRIRNSMVSIGAAKFPAHTLDITQPEMSTAKTSSYNALKATNSATSSTASVRMAGGEFIVNGTNNGSGASNVGVYVSSVTGGTANYDAIFNGGGNVGVATTSPWKAFSVSGNVAMSGLTASATGNAVCITTSNEITNAGAAGCTPSSIRFKENVTTLAPGYALNQLSKLNVVGFDYKEKQQYETNHSYGLIAEEVEGIDKNLVDYGYDGKPVSLHFEKITGLLVQAVQEQQNQIGGLASSTLNLTNSNVALNESVTTNSSNLDALTINLASTSQTTKTLAKALDATNDAVVALSSRVDELTATTSAIFSVFEDRTNSLIQGNLSSLISSSTFISALASSTAQVIASSIAPTIASSTADILASSSPSFITRIATAVKASLESIGDWTMERLTAHIVYTERVEAQTVAVSKGLEINDVATGQVFCVQIRNGEWDKRLGACTTEAPRTAQTTTNNPPVAQTTAPTSSTNVTITSTNTTSTSTDSAVVPVTTTSEPVSTTVQSSGTTTSTTNSDVVSAPVSDTTPSTDTTTTTVSEPAPAPESTTVVVPEATPEPAPVSSETPTS